MRKLKIHNVSLRIKFEDDEEYMLNGKAKFMLADGTNAFGNEFGYNDFSQIKHMALKNFRPVVGVVNKNKTWYIYNNEDTFYMCAARASGVKIYDLNLESDQKTFYYDHVIDLQMATMERRMWYDNYTMYDMITCYKKRFNI